MVLRGATINVYLAGTTTAATIYTSVTSITGVNSVTTSSTDGSFSFYIDAFDYGSFQKFKFVVSKPTLTDSTFTVDEVSVDEVVTGTYTISTAKIANSPIFVPYGVIFLKSGTGSINFNSSFTAGIYQIFSGFTTGITFGSLSTKEVYPEWWGAKGDSLTDDTAAITSAISSITSLGYGVGSDLIISRIYGISSSITVLGGVGVKGLGAANNAAGGAISSSGFLKLAAMSTDGLILNGNNNIRNITIKYSSGATANGIHINGNNVSIYDSAIIGVSKSTPSGIGIRIGNNTGSINCNSWCLHRVTVAGMSGDGIYIHDKPGSPPDANAGIMIGCSTNDNGDDGVDLGNNYFTTILGHLSEGNTGYGIHIEGTSYYTTIIGGDRENNTAGQIIVDSGAQRTSFIGLTDVITDNSAASVSINTSRPDLYIATQGTWTPVLAGDSTAGSNTYALQTGYWQRYGDIVSIQGVITLSAKDAAMNGNIIITGLPFSLPSGFTGNFAAINISQWGNFTLSANYYQLGGRIDANSSIIKLQQSGSGQTASTITQAMASNSSQILFTATYPIFKR